MTDDNSAWSEARDQSHQLVLQAALEDLESKAAQWEQDLLQSQVTVEKQAQQLQALEAEKQAWLQAKNQQAAQLSDLQSQLQAETSKVRGLEENQTQSSERADRLQSENDLLRQEIR